MHSNKYLKWSQLSIYALHPGADLGGGLWVHAPSQQLIIDSIVRAAQAASCLYRANHKC